MGAPSAERDRGILALHEAHGRRTVFRYRLSPDAGLDYVSPSVKDLTGYSDRECLAAADVWALLADPTDPAARGGFLAKASAREPLAMRWKRKDGSAVWVELDASVRGGEDGGPRFLEGSVEEMGARLRGEVVPEVLYRIAAAAAEASDEADLFDRIHDSVGRLLDATNFFIALHFPEDPPRAVNIRYYVDQDVSPSVRYRPEARRPFGHGMTEYILRTGEPLLADHAGLEDLVRRGEIDPRTDHRSTSWAGVPLRDGSRILGVMAIASYDDRIRFTPQDLELLGFAGRQVAMAINLRRAHDGLRERAEALERSNRELERFAYVASHDLQEPLRAVTGFLQLLEKRFGERLDDRGREYVGRAVAAAARMRGMIESLLEWARVTTRGEAFGPVDAGEALRHALENLQAAVLESGAAVEAGPMPVVKADGAQLLRLFQNLVGNALKFRDGVPHVSVRAEKADGAWLFSVQDDGIGIPAEHRARVFEIFQRLHERDRYPGSGIGLSICQKIVERHGGRIWAEAAPGKGSVFRFTIPEREGRKG